MNDQDGGDYRPVRYDPDTDNNRTNRPLTPDRDLDTRFDRDNDFNWGPNVDTDPRDIHKPGEPDTPFNMDEEEPDLDEEPSEERRGF